MNSPKVIPTIVPAISSDIQEVSEKYARFASFFQVDVADGKFAPNTTWLPSEGYVLPKEYDYEVHLMVADPYTVGSAFAKAGAHTLIAHVETLESPERTQEAFSEWKAHGVEAVGIAVLFQTPIQDVEPYLALADFLLLMTITRIGVQGIPYKSSAPARVRKFHEKFPETPISVDGGVSEANITELRRAGASRFGVGSAIAKAPDPAAAFTRLTKLAKGALSQ